MASSICKSGGAIATPREAPGCAKCTVEDGGAPLSNCESCTPNVAGDEDSAWWSDGRNQRFDERHIVGIDLLLHSRRHLGQLLVQFLPKCVKYCSTETPTGAQVRFQSTHAEAARNGVANDVRTDDDARLHERLEHLLRQFAEPRVPGQERHHLGEASEVGHDDPIRTEQRTASVRWALKPWPPR
eukprot:1669548-Prymnesium_polylepis.2